VDEDGSDGDDDEYESSIDSVTEALKKKSVKPLKRTRKRSSNNGAKKGRLIPDGGGDESIVLSNFMKKTPVAETKKPPAEPLKITSFFHGENNNPKFGEAAAAADNDDAKKKPKATGILSITTDKMKGVPPCDDPATHTSHETLDIPDFRSEGNEFNEKNINNVKDIATVLRHGNLSFCDTRSFAERVFERDVQPFVNGRGSGGGESDKDKPWTSTMFINPAMFNVVSSMLSMYSPKKCNTRDAVNEMRKLKKIEGTDMKWDNNFCTIASGQERSCASGKECIANKKMGFICKEFLTPTEHDKIMRTHVQSNIVKPCLFCISSTCMVATLLKKVNDVESRQTTSTYQPHFSIVNVEGSYRLTDCIPMTNTCFYPMVANHWSQMVPIIKDSVVIGVVRKGYLKYTAPVRLAIGQGFQQERIEGGGGGGGDDDEDSQNF